MAEKIAYPFDLNRLIEICRTHGVSMVGVFGSMARGQATPQSDIDLIVDFAGDKSLLDLVRLERELSAALGRKVETLTEAGLSPYLRPRILAELQVLYEAR